MARFLVAWEFGEDLGHLRRVLPIGRALRERGHEVAFAFRDATLLGGPARERFGAWAAPVLRRPATYDPSPVNAADVLLNLGFRDAGALRGVQRAWDSVVAAVRPQVVACDYAPNAMIAAVRHGLRRATVGSGFALPRSFDPLPAMRSGMGREDEALRLLDEQLRRNVKQAAGPGVPIELADLFRGDEDLLTTLPELDPHGPREARYLGPMASATEGTEASWDAGPPPRVLAYLKPRDARFRAVLQAMTGLGVQAIVAAPGMDAADARASSTARVRVFTQPLRLSPLLAEADLCIGHGGPGFAADALRAGVPLFLLPMHLEQELVTRRLIQQGVAVAHAGDASTLHAALAMTLADVALREGARRFARALNAQPARDAAREAAAVLESLAR